MSDINNNTAGAGNNGDAGTEKTFTQAEIDAIIEGRLAREKQKYADYESLKEKADKYDEFQQQNKSELQKATEKADALQAELDTLKKEGTVRQVREKVSKELNIPAELLSGEDEETCKKQAEAILKFAKPKSYPGTSENRRREMNSNQQADAGMRVFARQIFGGGE